MIAKGTPRHQVVPGNNILDMDIKEENIIKELQVYPTEQCNYVYPNGKQCSRNSVGKWNVCKKHGGDPVIQENLLRIHEIPDILKGKKYDPTFHPMEYLVLAKSGMSAVEIAAEFEVPLREIESWSETYLEFNKAYEIGLALHEAWYLKEGKENLSNRGYNSEMFKFLTGNKLGWSTKTESKNLNINAGVLVVPGRMTEEEWEVENG